MEAVRAKVGDGCLDKKCKRPGCRVSLKGVPESHLIIDFDEPDSPLDESQTRCDYLFVADGNRNGGWVVPLELKRGKYDASEVVKQLEAGRKVAEDIVPGKTKVRFRPVRSGQSATADGLFPIEAPVGPSGSRALLRISFSRRFCPGLRSRNAKAQGTVR